MARLRDDTPMTLEAHEIAALRSMHDRLDLQEVEEIYLPLSRPVVDLCRGHSAAVFRQRRFLALKIERCPTLSAFRLGGGRKSTHRARVAGAAGAMVAGPKVDLVTTDAFCFQRRA